VAVDGQPVEKRSTGKATTGCRKHAVRVVRDGVAVAELLRLSPFSPAEGRPLQVEVMAGGEVVHRPPLSEVRAHHLAARAELAPEALSLDDGPPALTAVFE
jgi:nicotinate phosphoribosyltransferase